MLPELFEIPFLNVTVKSYGVMMVVGFLAAVYVIRRLARISGQNPDYATNAALYGLISGVVGSRLFYVVHNYDQFRGDPLSVFAVWQGGLEFVGGVFLAIAVLILYLVFNRLSIRKYFSILAIGLMLGLSFGRIGCFLNGCCFGKPADTAVSVRFPYGSHPYRSQVFPDEGRNREDPYFALPGEFYGYGGEDRESWYPANEENKFEAYLKPRALLTDEQLETVRTEYRALPVHPTQLYSSVNALWITVFLFLFWYYVGRFWPGVTFSLMFILYGPTRFLIEFLRDDNPFEYGWWTITDGLTVSQNLGIYLSAAGILLMILFVYMGPEKGSAAVEDKRGKGTKGKSGKSRKRGKKDSKSSDEEVDGALEETFTAKEPVVKKAGRQRN
jgi:phosphatidylglycerol:prolipoprotein diacylglycerol transferase